MSDAWDQSGHEQWRDVPEDDNPFGTSGPVDGIVYAQDEESPELRYTGRARPASPALPVRPEARPIDTGNAAPWRPGGDVDVDKFRRRVPRANPLKGLLVGLVPIGAIACLIYVVVSWYGDALI